MSNLNRKWTDGMLRTEDWWAVWLGLIMFFAGLLTIWGIDIVGWMTKTKTWEWTNLTSDFSWSKVLKTSTKTYSETGPLISLFITYGVFTGLTCIGAYFQGINVKRFFFGFTIIFFITWLCWIVGHEAHFKSVDAIVKGKNSYEQFGLTWGLQLGGGFSYMLALGVGLVIGNFFKGFANFLKESAKPEWFIKTAIVYLGIKLGLMSMKASSFALDLALAGAAAVFVAYLLFWPIMYTIARKLFNIGRDAAAVLSSAISICGVSAAIATAGAIRAKPILPIAVSVLVVIYAMIELIILPGFYTAVAPNQPIVNGAAMGMTVKTDGADAAAGAILDEMMVSQHLKETGQLWESDWILSAAILTKIWIDVFIGVWAFLLALLWMHKVEKTSHESHIPVSEIWFRFPKFVIGYFIAWFFYVGIILWSPEVKDAAAVGANVVQSPMRKMMFMLTFVSMGILTDFSKLKGMGKFALFYAIGLFVVIAPIAYGVAYIFHHGMMPPISGQ
ncbi:MAG: putative sulfate exporter family transporter [Pseudomonadota bacterium]|nr:putative sulfate exporter family transporter [Pseudomonadota bacterium]